MPLAWLMMNNWLNSFAYRIDIGIFTLLIAAAVAASPQPTIGVSMGERTELWGFDSSAAPETLPDHLHHLAHAGHRERGNAMLNLPSGSGLVKSTLIPWSFR